MALKGNDFWPITASVIDKSGGCAAECNEVFSCAMTERNEVYNLSTAERVWKEISEHRSNKSEEDPNGVIANWLRRVDTIQFLNIE